MNYNGAGGRPHAQSQCQSNAGSLQDACCNAVYRAGRAPLGMPRPSRQQQQRAAHKLGEEVGVEALVVHGLPGGGLISGAAAQQDSGPTTASASAHAWLPRPTWECSTSRSASTSSATSPARGDGAAGMRVRRGCQPRPNAAHDCGRPQAAAGPRGHTQPPPARLPLTHDHAGPALGVLRLAAHHLWRVGFQQARRREHRGAEALRGDCAGKASTEPARPPPPPPHPLPRAWRSMMEYWIPILFSVLAILLACACSLPCPPSPPALPASPAAGATCSSTTSTVRRPLWSDARSAAVATACVQEAGSAWFRARARGRAVWGRAVGKGATACVRHTTRALLAAPRRPCGPCAPASCCWRAPGSSPGS
jgi:hypothetical protein